MQPTKILAGLQGFAAKCFARSVFVNQIAFLCQRALTQKTVEADLPQTDANEEARFLAAMGDAGMPTARTLDADALIRAHAAAFWLLRKACDETDPEKGQKPEHLQKRLVKLPDAIMDSVKRNTDFNLNKGRAEAKKTGADFTKREAAIRGEVLAEAKRQRETVIGPWLAAIAELRSTDDADLIDIVLEAVVDAGRDPAIEIRSAADKLRDVLKAKMEAGEYAAMETSVYALTTAAAEAAKKPAAPKDDTFTGAPATP
jgi:hypothetical protein